jgi:sigma-E factor negative regulatory protein RseC
VIEESGVVVSVAEGSAKVRSRRRDACGGCAVNGACGTSLLARFLGRKPMLLEAHNPIGAEEGEEVIVGMPEGALLEASFVAYLTPLLAMICGGIAGGYVAELAAPAHAEGLSVLGGIGALAAALVWVGRFSRSRAADERYRATILRRSGGGAPRVRVPGPDYAGRHHINGA